MCSHMFSYVLTAHGHDNKLITMLELKQNEEWERNGKEVDIFAVCDDIGRQWQDIPKKPTTIFRWSEPRLAQREVTSWRRGRYLVTSSQREQQEPMSRQCGEFAVILQSICIISQSKDTQCHLCNAMGLLDSALPQARTSPCHHPGVQDCRQRFAMPTQKKSISSFKLNSGVITSHPRLSDLSWDPTSNLKVSPGSSAMRRLFYALHQQRPFEVVSQPFSAALVFCYLKYQEVIKMSWPIQRLFSFRFCLKVWHTSRALTCSANTQNRELPTMA